jgi:hypothetical protein
MKSVHTFILQNKGILLANPTVSRPARFYNTFAVYLCSMYGGELMAGYNQLKFFEALK